MAGEGWDQWIGRAQIIEDAMEPKPARALAATLGLTGDPVSRPGDALPFPWTWLYFLQPEAKSNIGPDGHPKRGGFLPPVEHPRRMWAGSQCTFHTPILCGQPATKTTTIVNVAAKTGRAGPMVFVTLVHEIASGGVLAMRETQDIVYMDIPETFRPPAAQPLPACDHSQGVDIDPVFLFRFSALTFNGHRIHYDRPYTMDVEHYPGLVVHGPLQAILLYDYAMRLYPGRSPCAFRFRGMQPLFDFDTASVHARQDETGAVDLYTANGNGGVCMEARLEWAP